METSEYTATNILKPSEIPSNIEERVTSNETLQYPSDVEQKQIIETTQPQVQAEDLPPDGGYGWVCVACVFLINAHTWGINSVRQQNPTIPVQYTLETLSILMAPKKKELRSLSLLLPNPQLLPGRHLPRLCLHRRPLHLPSPLHRPPSHRMHPQIRHPHNPTSRSLPANPVPDRGIVCDENLAALLESGYLLWMGDGVSVCCFGGHYTAVVYDEAVAR